MKIVHEMKITNIWRDIKHIFDNQFGLLFYLAFWIVVAAMDPHKIYKLHFAFYFFMIFFVLYLIIKKNNIRRLIKVGILLILLLELVSIAVSGKKYLSDDESLICKIYGNNEVTLIERAYNLGYQNSTDDIFSLYFFKDKEVIIASENNKDILVNNLLKQYNGNGYNYKIIQDFTLLPADNLIEIFTRYPQYEAGNHDVFIIDDGIKSNRVVYFKINTINYFCSDKLYTGKDCYNLKEGDKDLTGNLEAVRKLSNLTIKNSNGIYNICIQIIAILFLLTIGGVVSFSLWGRKSISIALFMALPVGSLIWTVLGIAFVVLKVPYNLYTICTFFIIMMGIILIKNIKVFMILNYKKIFIGIFLLITILVYLSFSCHTFTSYDSIAKCKYGFMLSLDNNPWNYITDMAIFGMIEPFIHSIGYMMGGDYLYVLYPMFFVVTMGLFFCGLRFIIRKNIVTNEIKSNILYISLAFVIGVGTLILNNDFMRSTYYVMSHGLLSTYFLIFIIFSLYSQNRNIENAAWALFIPSVAIVITRTEGIIYILFLWTVFIGYMRSNDILRMGIGVCAVSMIWVFIQLIAYNGNSGDGFFFTPLKSIILICGLIMVVLFFLLVKKGKLLCLLEYKYFLFYLLIMFVAICLISVCFFSNIAKENLHIYISHFCNYIEPDSNAGFIWIFIFTFMALLCKAGTKTANYTVCIIMGYVLLVFMIFLFRGDLPMRIGYGDSGRRILVHIMPAAIWMILENILMIVLELAETDIK